jgi:hypothetical protein
MIARRLFNFTSFFNRPVLKGGSQIFYHKRWFFYKPALKDGPIHGVLQNLNSLIQLYQL